MLTTTPVAPAATDSDVERRLRLFAQCAAALVLAATLLVLAGYVFDSDALIGLGRRGAAMSPVTASALACLCAMILLRSTGRTGTTFGIAAGLLSASTLVSLATVGEDRVSAFVAREVFGITTAQSGRTALSTGACLLLLTFAASPIGASRLRSYRRVGVANASMAIALVVSGLGILGYAYGARLLFNVPPFSAMSLPTALCIFALSLATLAAQPNSGWAATIASGLAAGSTTRRQLLFTLLPPLLGWVLVRCLEADLIEANTSMALLVVLTIVPLAILVLRDGAMLNMLDTERRKSVEAQARMNADLSIKLAAQAAQLETQAEERLAAEVALNRTQRLEAVGQLTGGIAHDFNNLLMAVKGNLELMRRRLPDDSNVLRYVEHALAATSKGGRITQQLLSFSRTQRLEIRSIEVCTRLREALGLVMQALGPTTRIVLQTQCREAWAATDPDQLELAVLNLAVNGRDAMSGTGTIRIGLRTDRMDIGRDGRPVDAVVISVSDDGAGMSADVLAKATEPFFTTKARGSGTGLGLAQAYGFARQCGGELKIESAVGHGTTVEIWLRATARNQPAVASAIGGAAFARSAQSKRILVIDDDEAVRNAVAEALRQNGHVVSEASDGPEGLESLTRSRPDVAIIDFLMPGLNGAEVARVAQMRQPGLRIVFISGYSDTLALDGIANATVLRKPFDFEALFRSIEDLTEA